ncbi:MAG: hypothetical protein ACKOX3_10685 [Bacteroidota bacterium]
MKKVLIITYYYPPNTGAPAWRPFSWANNFYKENINTTIVTRHWNGNESKWEDFLKPNHSPITKTVHENYTLYCLPSKRSKASIYFSGSNWLSNLLGKPYFFLSAIFGKLNSEIDGALAFSDFIAEHLKSNQYDAAIITVPPFNMLQLTTLFQQYKIKLVVDVRDLWNNMALTNNYHPSLKQKIWDSIYSFHFKRWLKSADYVTVITPPFKEVLKNCFKGEMEVVYNGYENDMFAKIDQPKSEKFIFSIIGSVYPQQDLSITMKGLQLFLADKSPTQVQCRFIGLKIIPEISDMVKQMLPEEFVVMSERVSKEEAIRETKMATVLSYPGWLGVRGIISTKIFDYIASGNVILLAPGDKDIIDDLLQETNTGISVFSAEAFALTLNNWYDKWKNGEAIQAERKLEQIEFYSREHQAKILAQIIQSL